ncbi:MAG: glycosyl hydrolase [Ignavibacteriota bacterium]|nr:glycosyl hydrolase [Ignavibacteriota bacterium]
MKRIYTGLLIIAVMVLFAGYLNAQIKDEAGRRFSNGGNDNYQSAKPYTRWWWFAGIIKNEDVKEQLDWLKANGFGGVEIAFIYPVKRNPNAERFPWLGKEWQDVVTYAKMYSDSIGLGCDFTYGTLWPFGGTFVKDEDRTQIWNDTSFKQPLRLSWTHPDTGNVLNHLDKGAFGRYAKVMSDAFAPALKGSKSALFCDSWEVESKFLWTRGFDEMFTKKFGYDIKPFMDSIYTERNAGPRYDYMKLLSELVINEFFIPFTEESHRMNSLSRVQCMGSPTDIMKSYSNVDIPETEAMLYNPAYSSIVSSSAALSGKKIISSETFTCLYGFPAKHIREEQTADLKLVADALFANGVNQIIWHGMPYNPIGIDTFYFYATCHVGKRGTLKDEFKPFNDYMQKVSDRMRFGRTYSDVAVYLPLEDSWIAGEYPKELQLPWAWGAYELRYEKFNAELKGFHPLWINNDFLSKGTVKNNVLYVNDVSFKVLYVDAKNLDLETIKTMYKLAKDGLPVCLKQLPKQSGYIKSEEFETILGKLKSLPNVTNEFTSIRMNHLVMGDNVPDYWCRTDGKSLVMFFANPKAEGLTYPIAYGQSLQENTITKKVNINYKGKNVPVELKFELYQSLLLFIDEKGNAKFEDIKFVPKSPRTE